MFAIIHDPGRKRGVKSVLAVAIASFAKIVTRFAGYQAHLDLAIDKYVRFQRIVWLALIPDVPVISVQVSFSTSSSCGGGGW